MNTESPNLIQQANAAARVILLILTSVGFAAIWESDVRHQDKVLAERRAKQQSRTFAGRTEPQEHSRQHLTRALTPPSVREVSVGGVGQTREWPLPAGIALGTYRVVDNSGAVEMLQVTSEVLRKQGIAAGKEARDMYLLDESDRRIYFIRLNKVNRVAMSSTKATD